MNRGYVTGSNDIPTSVLWEFKKTDSSNMPKCSPITILKIFEYARLNRLIEFIERDNMLCRIVNMDYLPVNQLIFKLDHRTSFYLNITLNNKIQNLV